MLSGPVSGVFFAHSPLSGKEFRIEIRPLWRSVGVRAGPAVREIMVYTCIGIPDGRDVRCLQPCQSPYRGSSAESEFGKVPGLLS